MAAQEKTNEPTNTEQNSKKTIAIVQLARIGDLIQTYQACLNLSQQNPDVRLVLIARAKFSRGLSFLLNKVFDKIYTIELSQVLKDDLEHSLEATENVLTKINNEDIDALLNLNYSKSSNYLCSLVKAQHKLGPWYDRQGHLQISDSWSQFIYSNVLETNLNPFNLVDLFKKVIGISSQKIEEKTVYNSNKNNITLHPFASSERKCWKTSKWSEIVYKTLKDFPDKKITIVGSENEVAKASQLLSTPTLKNFQDRIINKTGKTNLEEVYHILKESCFFIGHDSMVGHLASVAQTPTLTISLGSVRPIETAPYQENAIILAPRVACFPCKPQTSCNYYQCHADISYQAVNACITQLLKTGDIDTEQLESENSAFHINAIDIYKAQFTDDGVFQLSKLSSAPQSLSDIFRGLYRITWSFVMSQRDEKSNFPQLTKSTHQKLHETLLNIEQLYELNEFGKKYSQYILEEISTKTPRIGEIKKFSEKIDEIDHLTKMLGQANPYLLPIINFYTLKKGSLSGENIVELSESSYLVFHECSNVCGVLYELIEKTIQQHKKESSPQVQGPKPPSNA